MLCKNDLSIFLEHLIIIKISYNLFLRMMVRDPRERYNAEQSYRLFMTTFNLTCIFLL
jgi:hypothetical protein